MSPVERGLAVLVVLLGAVLVMAVGAVGFVWWRADAEVTRWKARGEEERQQLGEALMQRDASYREKAELQRAMNQLQSRLNGRENTVMILRTEKEALHRRLEVLTKELETLKAAKRSPGGADGAAGAP
jgi:septal ring factor EnvC (AmiA/AmiB activator)